MCCNPRFPGYSNTKTDRKRRNYLDIFVYMYILGFNIGLNCLFYEYTDLEMYWTIFLGIIGCMRNMHRRT